MLISAFCFVVCAPDPISLASILPSDYWFIQHACRNMDYTGYSFQKWQMNKWKQGLNTWELIARGYGLIKHEAMRKQSPYPYPPWDVSDIHLQSIQFKSASESFTCFFSLLCSPIHRGGTSNNPHQVRTQESFNFLQLLPQENDDYMSSWRCFFSCCWWQRGLRKFMIVSSVVAAYL